jgi:hypothetical protein
VNFFTAIFGAGGRVVASGAQRGRFIGMPGDTVKRTERLFEKRGGMPRIPPPGVSSPGRATAPRGE